jgi:secondary thiamine-phosphate synthase enzyme
LEAPGIAQDISEYDVGLANLHLLHTSAGLSINENACSAVRRDMEKFFDALVPDGNKVCYEHDDEGPDDMPSHIKGVLTGFTLTVPITRGRLALGTWQGVYLFETRDHGGPRSIVVTLQGVKRADGRRYA